MLRDVGGQEIAVGADVDDDQIRAPRAENDETNGGRTRLRAEYGVAFHALLLEQLEQSVTKGVSPNLAKVSRCRSQPTAQAAMLEPLPPCVVW